MDKKHLFLQIFPAITLVCALLFVWPDSSIEVCASALKKEQTLAANRALPIESNEITNWPTGPVVGAESAILMDLDTGVILYEKNIHSKQYPASTTKILTSLIAAENCAMDETVTFSHDAVFGIPAGSNHVAMDVGDTLSMETCLQAILIRSANEVSYAVAEHIGGSWDGFADMMNERARQLGCMDSNFVNPNGLPDENHYTSAHDLAMIGRAFFANESLCKITKMPLLYIDKEDEDLIDANQMELLAGKKYAYDGLVGCKTGYTEDARSCLVACAERNGMRLICVVLKDEAPCQYEDTVALLNYGFSNFEKANISQTETKYNIEGSGFYSDIDIFGSSKPILSLNQTDCIILPKTATFEDTVSSISYETLDSGQVAVIHYTYQGVDIGSASVDLAIDKKQTYSFDPEVEEEEEEHHTTPSVIFINVLKILLWVTGISGTICLVIFIYKFFRNYNAKHPNSRRNWKKNRRKQRNYNQMRTSSQLQKRRLAIKQAKRRQRRNNSKWR